MCIASVYFFLLLLLVAFFLTVNNKRKYFKNSFNIVVFSCSHKQHFHFHISHWKHALNKFTSLGNLQDSVYAMNDDNVFFLPIFILHLDIIFSRLISSLFFVIIYSDVGTNVIRFLNAKDAINFELTLLFE